jgi:hypothetical protein
MRRLQTQDSFEAALDGLRSDAISES